MTVSLVQNRLRPGRDANDTSWVIQRYLADWQAGQSRGVTFDPTAQALTLAPLARPEIAADWLPLAPVSGPEGTLYKADPQRDVILRKRACDADYAPLPGIGGAGFATGRLNTPTGLAFDRQGRLYVVDSANRRVQVFNGGLDEIEAVLTGDLVQPVHVAVSLAGEVFVADVGTGHIHVFSPSLVPCGMLVLSSHDPWTGALWSNMPPPRPLAVTVLDDGSLAVFDPHRAMLWHMAQDGRPLNALPWPGAGEELPGWAATPARFASEGEMIVGPLDGGKYDLAWHRVLIDGDAPDGSSMLVQTFASNSVDVGTVAWAPRAPLAIPTAQADRAEADFDRLVLANDDLWPLAKAGRMTRAQPDIHRFDGDGPVAVDTFDLPADIAQRLQTGDRIRLTTEAGGTAEYSAAGIADRSVDVAATGPQSVLQAPMTISLIMRDGRRLACGPVDLTGFADGFSLGALAAEAEVEAASLPHLLASILKDGDVLVLSGADGTARVEIIEVREDPVTVALTMAVEGDFSTAALTLLDTRGRLVVREPLDDVAFLPPGSVVSVIADARIERHDIAFVEGALRTIWLAAPMADEITDASWTNAEVAQPRATDKGRYLWVRMVLRGRPVPVPGGIGAAPRASAAPTIRALRVTGPRPSLLSWLPAIFSNRDPRFDAPGALFLERFLALFEGQFTRMEDAYESVSRLLNPQAADETWLEFLAAWMDFAFDPSWPIASRRQLVIEGADLQAAAGTPRALARYLEIYTGAPAGIVEDFRDRPPPPMQLGARGALGVAPLGAEDGSHRFAHQFTARVTLRPDYKRDRDATLSAIHRIIETMKPAHSSYRLDTGEARTARIGMDTSIDRVFIPGPTPKNRCLCDPSADAGPRGQTGQVSGGFRLGGRMGSGPISEVSFQGDPA